MKNSLYFIVLILIFISSCKSKEEKQVKDDENNKRHCYIINVYEDNNSYFATIQYIKFYLGEEALKVAIENNDAIEEIDENGKPVYFLLNDYYIDEKDKSVFTYEFDSAPEFSSWMYSEDLGMHTVNYYGVDAFLNYYTNIRVNYENVPFAIEFKNNKITKLIEEYIP